eukprot:8622218-Heterocapsa_arctica.AAC.1
MEEVEPDALLWACFAGLPMGWSWALYFCHASLSQCCLRAQLSCGVPSSLVGDRGPPPPITRGSGVIAPYVDNGN